MQLSKNKIKHGFFILTLIFLVLGFRALIFEHAPFSFSSPEEDMSYAWYVPAFSLYVLWKERDKICLSLGRGSLIGLFCTIPFFMLALMGVRGLQIRFEIIALVGLLVTVPWAFYGYETAKRVAFPAAYLLFCIPLNSFLDIITVHLRLFATNLAFFILQVIGCEAVSQGTAIISPTNGFAIDVASPCSGLRSIFALMALIGAYAYYNQKTWTGRAILFSLSIPIAILSNVVRILTIFLVGQYANAQFATGFYHDYSGYVVFVVAIFMMVAIGELISKFKFFAIKKEKKPNIVPENPNSRFSLLKYGAITLFVCSLMILQSVSPSPSLTEAKEFIFPEYAGLQVEKGFASEAELTTLPKDTRIQKRIYSKNGNVLFRISEITSGKYKSSIHRPELCLPSQGFVMLSPRTVKAGKYSWRVISLLTKDGSEFLFAYTFFNQDSFATASHVSRIFKDICDRTFLNKIDRWTMLTIDSSISDIDAFVKILERVEVPK
jgi:exosortase